MQRTVCFLLQSLKLLVCALVFAFLSACGPIKDDSARFASLSAADIYKEAHQYYKTGHYHNAVESYEGLIAHYPFGEYATKAQYELIDAYYKQHDIPSAVAAADHFIKLHPTHPNIDSVYYKKGMAQTEENRGPLQRMVHLDMSLRDTAPLQEALSSFQWIVQHHPKSPYAVQAREKIVALRRQLAHHIYQVADYYFRRGAYIAVINRGHLLMDEYGDTPYAHKIKKYMQKSYKRLQLPCILSKVVD